MVAIWCVVESGIEVNKIKEAATEHAERDLNTTSGYSANLFDDLMEDDWDE